MGAGIREEPGWGLETGLREVSASEAKEQWWSERATLGCSPKSRWVKSKGCRIRSKKIWAISKNRKRSYSATRCWCSNIAASDPRTFNTSFVLCIEWILIMAPISSSFLVQIKWPEGRSTLHHRALGNRLCSNVEEQRVVHLVVLGRAQDRVDLYLSNLANRGEKQPPMRWRAL